MDQAWLTGWIAVAGILLPLAASRGRSLTCSPSSRRRTDRKWLIARQRVGEVLSVPRVREAGEAGAVRVEEPSVPEWERERVTDAPAVVSVPGAARAGSIVPV